MGHPGPSGGHRAVQATLAVSLILAPALCLALCDAPPITSSRWLFTGEMTQAIQVGLKFTSSDSQFFPVQVPLDPHLDVPASLK